MVYHKVFECMKIISRIEQERRLKISMTLTGKKRKPQSQAWRDNISKSKKGKKLPPRSQAHRDAISEARKGKKFPQGWRDSISNALKGKKHTQKHCDNLSKARNIYIKKYGMQQSKGWLNKELGHLVRSIGEEKMYLIFHRNGKLYEEEKYYTVTHLDGHEEGYLLDANTISENMKFEYKEWKDKRFWKIAALQVKYPKKKCYMVTKNEKYKGRLQPFTSVKVITLDELEDMLIRR